MWRVVVVLNTYTYFLHSKVATLLDSIKWSNYPPSPQSNDEGAKEQETRHFGIEMGGEG